MPKHYCDYCDVFLTHDSTSVRKDHNSGRNHLANVRDYYASLGHDKAQNIIDQITSAYESGGPPPGGFGFGPHHLGAPPPSMFPPHMGFGPPQPGPQPGFGQQPGFGPPQLPASGPGPGPGPGFPMPSGGPFQGLRGPNMNFPPFAPGGFSGLPPGGPPVGPPGVIIPPFVPNNSVATSAQMDRGSSMDNSREGDVDVRANGDPNGNQPAAPKIHPDRVRMIDSNSNSRL